MAAPLQSAAHKLCAAVTLATWGTMCPLLVNVRQLQGYSHVPHHFFFLKLIGPLFFLLFL